MGLTKNYYSIKQLIFNGTNDDISTYVTQYSLDNSFILSASDPTNTQTHGSDVAIIAGDSNLSSTNPMSFLFNLETSSPGFTMYVYGSTTSNFSDTVTTTAYSSLDVLARVYVPKNATTVQILITPKKAYTGFFFTMYGRQDNLYNIRFVGDKTFKILHNIVNYFSSAGVAKIGIEAAPGTFFSVNGNSMIIGPNGKYELYHRALTISKLCIQAEEDKPFIITAKYQE